MGPRTRNAIVVAAGAATAFGAAKAMSSSTEAYIGGLRANEAQVVKCQTGETQLHRNEQGILMCAGVVVLEMDAQPSASLTERANYADTLTDLGKKIDDVNGGLIEEIAVDAVTIVVGFGLGAGGAGGAIWLVSKPPEHHGYPAVV